MSNTLLWAQVNPLETNFGCCALMNSRGGLPFGCCMLMNSRGKVLLSSVCYILYFFPDICQLRLDFDNFDIVETTTGCVISTPFPFHFLVFEELDTWSIQISS